MNKTDDHGGRNLHQACALWSGLGVGNMGPPSVLKCLCQLLAGRLRRALRALLFIGSYSNYSTGLRGPSLLNSEIESRGTALEVKSTALAWVPGYLRCKVSETFTSISQY